MKLRPDVLNGDPNIITFKHPVVNRISFWKTEMDHYPIINNPDNLFCPLYWVFNFKFIEIMSTTAFKFKPGDYAHSYAQL